MDAKKLQLQEKIENLLRQASTVASEIQAIDQGNETPHFDQIEFPANALGKEFSRLIQSKRASEVAANGLGFAPCPECNCKCRIVTSQRQVDTIDGPIDLTETVAKCRRCRRSFFPSAYQIGI